MSEPKSFSTQVYNFLATIYRIAKGGLWLLILLCLFLMVSGALVGSSVDAIPKMPSGWTRVHESTKFKVEPSLQKKAGLATTTRPVMAVLRFDGNEMASDRYRVARHVDEIITNKSYIDGVIAVVNSPGGGVAEYGQVYADLKRLRDAGIDLTVCIDTYGASGGYLMSLPAKKIVAAPFSIVGSIGVVSEMMNFNKFLSEHGIEPLILTAGKYKRTLTPTGAVTEEGKQHYQEQLETMHRAFIDVVKTFRPQIDTDKVCTGDHWTAKESLDQNLGLVDELATSNEYLLKIRQTHSLLLLSEAKPGFFEGGLLGGMEQLGDHMVDTVIDRMRMSQRTY